jgi:hypothetical protein
VSFPATARSLARLTFTVRNTAWNQAQEDKAKLVNSIKVFREKLKEDGSTALDLANFDPETCTWSEVKSELALAKKLYQNEAERSKTKVYLNKLGKHEQDVSAWLGWLPAGDYGAPVCGELRVS